MESHSRRTFKIVHSSFGQMIKDQLAAIYDNQDLVDVTLTSKGAFFTAHKVILSLHSGYFMEIFKNNTCKHPTIILCNAEPKLIDQLLTFIYKGTLILTEEEMDEFIRFTDMLQINGMLSNNIDSAFNDELSEVNENGDECNNETILNEETAKNYTNEDEVICQVTNVQSLNGAWRKKRKSNNYRKFNNKRISYEDDDAQNKSDDSTNSLDKLDTDIINHHILEPHITIGCSKSDENEESIEPYMKYENQAQYMEQFGLFTKPPLEFDNCTEDDGFPNNNEYENMENDISVLNGPPINHSSGLTVKVETGTKQSKIGNNIRAKKETSSSDIIEFRKASTGKLHLLHNSFTFHKNTMRRERVYWLCSAYHSPVQCRARCVTVNGKLFSVTGDHNHAPDYRASKHDTS